MLSELFRREARPRVESPFRLGADDAYEARRRLIALREALATRTARPQSPWNEPPVFFFDPARQAEFEAACHTRVMPNDPLAEQAAAEVIALCESVEVRRMARAIAGLADQLVHWKAPAFRMLADLIAVPDDETILVLQPGSRRGFRLHIRGIVDAHQFQVLMLEALADELGIMRLPGRFAAFCRDAHPLIAAGVPMVAELPFQMLQPGALRSDATILEGFAACDHWLWGWQPLSVLPRVDGERVVVLGQPAYRQTWEVERRFPAMAAEATLLDVLSPFQTADRLGRLIGRPIPVRPEEPKIIAFSRAA